MPKYKSTEGFILETRTTEIEEMPQKISAAELKGMFKHCKLTDNCPNCGIVHANESTCQSCGYSGDFPV